jgi:ABC-type dipeptide/oligopeptide/nickel transport system permease subunit
LHGASLAFVGLGVKPPIATWGGMIREGFERATATRWRSCRASLSWSIFALNLLGDGLRDAIDPKLKVKPSGPPEHWPGAGSKRFRQELRRRTAAP